MPTNNHSFTAWRRKLKQKIMCPSDFDDSLADEYVKLKYVLSRTVEHGESDSVLLLGFRGSGKTTVSRIFALHKPFI